MRSSNSDDWVAVGRIRSPHGVRGEVAVEVLTDLPQRFSDGSPLYLENPGGEPIPVRVERARPHKNFWLVRLTAWNTRTDAESLRGRRLLIPERSLAALPPRHYYPFRLIGCQVIARSGLQVGEVSGVLEGAGGALLEVRHGDREILIPMVQGIVLQLDEAARRIDVDLPEGLMDLNQ